MDAGDAVVVSVLVRGRGASSGATFAARIAHAFRLRDGKVIFVGSYRSLTSAKEAVGLRA